MSRINLSWGPPIYFAWFLCTEPGGHVHEHPNFFGSPCEEQGTHPKPQKVKPKPRTDLSVRHALSSLLYLVDSGLMEWDALCAPMTMGVKKPGAF